MNHKPLRIFVLYADLIQNIFKQRKKDRFLPVNDGFEVRSNEISGRRMTFSLEKP